MACKRYFIHGMGVPVWLFWEFFHARWKILFLCGGEHVRWKQDENCHARWEWSCKVTFVWWREQLDMRAGKVDARWELPHEVRIVMQGDFCMVEGTTGCEGMWGGCDMIATWGENGHVRWLLHGGGDNWMWGHVRWMWDDCHMTWEWSCEVTFVWWMGQLNMRAHEMDMRWECPWKVGN